MVLSVFTLMVPSEIEPPGARRRASAASDGPAEPPLRLFSIVNQDSCSPRTLDRTAVLVLLLVCLSSTGCVRRRFTVRSNPPGAMVWVDDDPIGPTPVSFPYTYYGTRKIRLVKDGFETLTVMQRLPTPWYQIVPLDFVSEVVVPWEIRDQRTMEFQLTPQMIVPRRQLLQRAENLRRGTRNSSGLPPRANLGGPPPGNINREAPPGPNLVVPPGQLPTDPRSQRLPPPPG